MYFEFQTSGREEFKYPYTGQELLEAAIRCRDKYRADEMGARKALAALLSNPDVGQSDPRISQLRKDVEFNGKQYEACSVYVTGFRREPERVFNLEIGDVVYFGLIEAG